MILVVGGTGRLGRAVTRRLLDGGHEVQVLTRGRSGPAPAGARWLQGDVTTPATVSEALRGATTVIAAMTGFPDASPNRVDRDGLHVLAEGAARTGAHLVLVSVAQAAADGRAELFRAKAQAEALLRRSGAAGTVVRPDVCAETWIELLEQTAKGGRPLVFGRGTNPFGWVSVRDTTSLVVRAALDEELRGRTLTLCGPERFGLAELATKVMTANGWTGRPRHVPRAALHAMAGTVGLVVPRQRRLARAALAMDELDPAVDDARHAVPGLPCTTVDSLLATSATPERRPA